MLASLTAGFAPSSPPAPLAPWEGSGTFLELAQQEIMVLVFPHPPSSAKSGASKAAGQAPCSLRVPLRLSGNIQEEPSRRHRNLPFLQRVGNADLPEAGRKSSCGKLWLSFKAWAFLGKAVLGSAQLSSQRPVGL